MEDLAYLYLLMAEEQRAAAHCSPSQSTSQLPDAWRIASDQPILPAPKAVAEDCDRQEMMIYPVFYI